MQAIQTIDVTAKRPAAGSAVQTVKAKPAGDKLGNKPSTDTGMHLWANGSFSFHDMLDAINPLQHIPVVSTIYREITGDKIGNAARVVGDGLYGGPIGALLGLANAVSVADTGKDLSDRAVALIEGGKNGDTGAAQPQSSGIAQATIGQTVPGQTASGQTALGHTALGQVVPDQAVPGVTASPTVATAAKMASAGSASPTTASVKEPSAPGAATGGLSIQAALAALPSRPPISLPYFPGSENATASASDTPQQNQPSPPIQLASITPSVVAAPAPSRNVLPAATASAALPTASLAHGIAIDTSEEGIMALRSRGHGPAAVPLQVSSGSFLAQANGAALGQKAASGSSAAALTSTLPSASTQAASTQAASLQTFSGASVANAVENARDDHDFVTRMRQGLEKYSALMAKQKNMAGTQATWNKDTGGSFGALGSNEQASPMPAIAGASSFNTVPTKNFSSGMSGFSAAAP